MRSTTLCRVSTAALAALTLAACSGGGSTDTTADPDDDRAAVSEEESSSAPAAPAGGGGGGAAPAEEPPADEAPASEDEPASGDADAILGRVVEQAAADRGIPTRSVTTVEGTIEGQAVETRIESVVAGDDQAISTTTSGAGLPGGASQSVEMRRVDGLMYVRSPLFEAQYPGVDWVGLDPAAASATGMDAQLESAEADALESLDALRDAQDVELVGEEEIDGVPTVHLTIRARAGDVLPGGSADDGEFDPDQIATYDLWVDEDDRVRRLRIAATVEGMELVITTDILEYGGDVTVEAPPAEDVNDITELLQRGQG